MLPLLTPFVFSYPVRGPAVRPSEDGGNMISDRAAAKPSVGGPRSAPGAADRFCVYSVVER